MIDYTTILCTNYLDKLWAITGNDYDSLQWDSETRKPTQAELDAQWVSVQTKLAKAITDKATAREALLTRLGITAEEAQLLLGGI